MGVKQQIAMLVVAFVMFKFLTNPPPELTSELSAWRDMGQFLDFNGFDIFYNVRKGSGEGGTLVCLHGFPTFSYDWSKIVDGLSQQFSHIILLDFIGFGFSAKPTQHNYTISEQADIVERLLVTLGVADVHLISHDYGDTVALELLARYNDRDEDGKLKILSLCMLNGGVFTETLHPRLIQKLLLRPWLGPVLSGLMVFPFFKHGLGQVFGTRNMATDEDFWNFWCGLRYNYGDRVTYRILQYIPERYAQESRWVGALQRTHVPVHMIYGPADPVNPPEFVTHYRKVVPNPSISVLPTTIGHYPQWEDPDAVLESYANFMLKVNQGQKKPTV